MEEITDGRGGSLIAKIRGQKLRWALSKNSTKRNRPKQKNVLEQREDKSCTVFCSFSSLCGTNHELSYVS